MDYTTYAWENLNNDLIKEVNFVRFTMIFFINFLSQQISNDDKKLINFVVFIIVSV